MSEVTLRPPSAFPRPTSLYMPDLGDSTPSLLRSSTYSPFPIFPGANADPHNLDRFLLPPDDPSWLLHLAPPSDALLPQRTEPLKDSPLPVSRGLKKVRSFSMLHRPSPLSQPPVGANEPDEARTRKRSNSVDSLSSPKSEGLALQDEAESAIEMKEKSLSKKTLRQAFQFRRKSTLSMTDLLDSPSDNVKATLPLTTPTATPLSDESNPSTPMSSRSGSYHSEISSASSSSSSEGVKTPIEAPQTVDVGIAGGKLAVALAAAEEKANKKGSWRGWLGGKRAVKSAPADTVDASAESSPSSTLAPSTVPQLTLTPSPNIVASRPASISSTDRAINRSLAIEQTRRISMRKLGQLRSPSPHPLALTLRRQYSNLPDEIACSIQSDQKVFPRSVNVYDATSGLHPMQGGLITSLGIRHVLNRLEKGDCPETPLLARRPSDPMTMPRPRGVLDFVKRLPFEERNLVFFANGTCSPISMARPGYGVWDLDFSPYILALSAVDSTPALPWPMMPRASVGPMDHIEKVLTVDDHAPSPESEMEEVIVSPSPIMLPLEDSPERSPIELEEPVSSFRKSRPCSKAWSESSDEDDDDDSPLASVYKRTKSSVTLALPKEQEIKHERSRSTPTTKRVSIIEDQEIKQRKNLDEVARARERRQANITGELERRAEAEKHRPPPSAYRRSSTMESTVRRGSAPTAANPTPTREGRRRTQSSYDMSGLSRPEASRSPSEGLSTTKRYHSFYELPRQAPPQPPQLAHVAAPAYMPPIYPAYTHPAMQAFPTLSPSHSMMFPTGYMQPMMAMPQMMPQQPMMAYGQQPNPFYLQMQGRGNSSSLSVPDARTARPRSTHQPSTRSSRPSRIA